MGKKRGPNVHRGNPPEWFKASDFGIFIHWGPASVPAFAPVETDDYYTLIRNGPGIEMFSNMPYAEWYQNSLRIQGSPVYRHHQAHYGGKPYTAFADQFKKDSRDVDVAQWARVFKAAGAHYVVFVTKHHDGFVMYDSKVKNPRISGYHLETDLVGQLAQAVRGQGMRFGVYYSSLLDWTFTKTPITNASELLTGDEDSQEYKDYCFYHWMELIDRYQPDILWSDIGYPRDKRILDLFSHFYQTVPEGLVNDRWQIQPRWMRNACGAWLVNHMAERLLKKDKNIVLDAKYYDYRTIEYTSVWEESEDYVEMCRGMDKSFAYNRFSRQEDFITADEVRETIALLKPKKGRLLLNVGPDSQGNIPPHQMKVLEELANE